MRSRLPLAGVDPRPAPWAHQVAGRASKLPHPLSSDCHLRTFSTRFAAPFLPLHPARYAGLLNDRLRRHGSTVWLVNTGWTGGPYGRGSRIRLAHTRAMVRAVLAGALEGAPFRPDPVFGLLTPDACPGVPGELLRPRDTWKDPAEYDGRARQLAGLSRANFEAYAGQVSEDVRRAGPRG